MSALAELIMEWCPEGAEYKPLSSLCRKNPKSKTGAKKAEAMEEGDVPFFTSGQKIFHVKESLVDGENLFINDGGMAGVNYFDGPANYADHVISIRPDGIVPKFLFYYLDSQKERMNKEMFRGSGLKNIDKRALFDMEIPLPPLPVQTEIVRLLDAFAELTGRRKQYEYYRDELLNFDSS